MHALNERQSGGIDDMAENTHDFRQALDVVFYQVECCLIGTQAQEFPGTFEGFLQTIRVREKVDEFEKNYTGLLDIVVDNPKALYKFFQRYNYLNAQIASSIAGLVGNIGMSREIFIDIKIFLSLITI